MAPQSNGARPDVGSEGLAEVAGEAEAGDALEAADGLDAGVAETPGAVAAGAQPAMTATVTMAAAAIDLTSFLPGLGLSLAWAGSAGGCLGWPADRLVVASVDADSAPDVAR
jgi:hypothetical protein